MSEVRCQMAQVTSNKQQVTSDKCPVVAPRFAGPRNYVQPRNKKIMSKIGIGIPRSQSKMYPVAPACLNLSLKRILISFFLKIARERAAGLGKLSEASVIGYWLLVRWKAGRRRPIVG